MSNLPVDAALEMGADVIIAVNVSQPLLPKEELGSLTRVTGQMLHGCCRDAEEQMVHQLLMAAGQLPESTGQGERDQEVRHRQQQVSLFFQPFLRLTVLAFGTMAVPARIVGVRLMPALITFLLVPTES